MKNIFYTFFFITTAFLNIFDTEAQCITSFPSKETFENSNGGWTTGGTSSDWAWGTPAKPVINAAGAGIKSWVTGGLNRSAYNDGENSWLMTRCYNFSGLTNPQVNFKIFWEIERRFDGAALEYTIDGGATWLRIGSETSNANCDGVNWYNFTPILYLGNTAGWSGNVQSTSGSCQGGNGSGNWLTAMHKLNFLAGWPNVQFRFVFGAGTQCNGYDGFAVDDFEIRETPPNSASYSYTCNADRSISFFSTPAFCQQSVLWNFDDIASGSSNTSADQNPVHVFSAPGIYNVTFTVLTSNNAPANTSQIISVTELTTTQTDIRCAGESTGSISAQVNPAGSYQYVWNTTPVQNTSSINNLTAGSYILTVSSPTTCSINKTIVITEPAALAVSIIATAAVCIQQNGSATTTVSGGVAPYNYLWSDGNTNSAINNLNSGDYSVKVTDANGCSTNDIPVVIPQVDYAVEVTLGPARNICPGETLLLNPLPGNYATYLWQDNSNAQTFSVTLTGNYALTVTDAFGCTGTASVNIVVDCSEIYFPSAFTPGDNDDRNPSFGPLGTNVGSASNYLLQVYNRAGQLIFSSRNPLERWFGTFKGKKLDTQLFVWQASFNYRGKSHYEKGTLMLIR